MRGQLSLEFLLTLTILLGIVIFVSNIKKYEIPTKIETEGYALYIDNLFSLGAPFKINEKEIRSVFSENKIGQSRLVQKKISKEVNYETYPQVFTK